MERILLKFARTRNPWNITASLFTPFFIHIDSCLARMNLYCLFSPPYPMFFIMSYMRITFQPNNIFFQTRWDRWFFIGFESNENLPTRCLIYEYYCWTARSHSYRKSSLGGKGAEGGQYYEKEGFLESPLSNIHPPHMPGCCSCLPIPPRIIGVCRQRLRSLSNLFITVPGRTIIAFFEIIAHTNQKHPPDWQPISIQTKPRVGKIQ